MFEKAALMWLYAEHPVHAGTGSGVGAIDLPIQRERVTNWPIVQPSGLKGALRELFDKKNRKRNDPDFKAKICEVFGPETQAPDLHSGAVSFTEARLLLFPVRSLKGTFAYLTCPLAVERLQRDLETIKACGGPDLTERNSCRLPQNLTHPGEAEVLVNSNAQKQDSCLVITPSGQNQGPQVVLEEFTFTAQADSQVGELAKWLVAAAPSLPWLDKANLAKRVAVVADNVFKDFVEMSTEVITRNQIDNKTGTVAERALWTEEHLPRESVLYAPIFAAPSFLAADPKLNGADAVINFLTTNGAGYLWIGGNTTVGRGLVRVAFAS
uniref:Type III-B CRISPR module RAMP protein Cmr4 n=1 Tax=Desulfobacca acetoxidans TaxID=60893 RepID=A0A7V4G9T2_9BACT